MISTRVDFYVTQGSSPEHRFHLCCRLLEKAYQTHHTAYVFCQNAEEAGVIDQLLWSFKEESFIPHQILGENHFPTPAPIQIGSGDSLPYVSRILFNLSLRLPEFHGEFPRIIEIVTEDPVRKAATREHFKFYKQCRYTIHVHDLAV